MSLEYETQGQSLLRNLITPTDLQPAQPSLAATYRWRRWLVFALNLATFVALTALMTRILASGGWTWAEPLMLLGFAITLPWLSIGMWNALIGLGLRLTVKDLPSYLTPAAGRISGDEPITYRTALAMTVRNEDAALVVRRLETMQDDLIAKGLGGSFDLHLLSDSNRPEAIAQEEREIAEWRARSRRPDQIHYRRRSDNTGFKAGNVREFVERCGDDYELFIPLDADSLLSARAIARLVRIMQKSPEIGLLQGLVVGMPAKTFFARVFQFGMRHGMRSYTAGSAWWQGDCGPFWGHNAAIRTAAFRDCCKLPLLPGKPPLGGHILSHDQVEAAMMRAAGYEVRVLCDEEESWEENPPALPDFIKRDLRWCQGNMQYWRLLALPGLVPTSRVQLGLAILMYLGAPGWILFLTASAIHAWLWTPEMAASGPAFPVTLGITLFAVIMIMALMPKIVGVIDVLISRRARRAYGGAARVMVGALSEFVFSTLMAPVIAVAQTRFLIGLVFGKRIAWDAQRRAGYGPTWGEALRGLWLQTVLGIALLASLIYSAPSVVPWAAPLLISLMGATFFAVLTAARWPSKLSCWMGLWDIPEDRSTKPALQALSAPARPTPEMALA
ncbi:MAG: glucans biosynthesis glucosyltransferase MdoH [Pseudomonadota bacterium]